MIIRKYVKSLWRYNSTYTPPLEDALTIQSLYYHIKKKLSRR